MIPNIIQCYVHGNPSNCFCSVCMRLICSECNFCVGHAKQTIPELLAKEMALQKNDILIYHRPNIVAAMECKQKELENVMLSIHNTEEAVVDLEENIQTQKEDNKNDITLSESIIAYLSTVKTKARSDVLLDSIQRSIELLEIDEQLSMTIKRYMGRLESMETSLHRLRIKTKRLEMEKEIINKLMLVDVTNPLNDTEIQLALILFELNQGFCSATAEPTFTEYKSFPHVEHLFEVDKVCHNKLIDIGNGINVSTPVKLIKRLREGDEVFASLSHNGILAICSRLKRYKYGFQLTNLFNGSQVDTKVENLSNIGFYDESFILLTRWLKIRYSTVANMFEGGIVSKFDVADTGKVNCVTDVSILNSTRKLIYCSVHSVLCEYDVDTKTNRRLELHRTVQRLGFLTGIDVGVRVFFAENDGTHFNSLNGNGEISVSSNIAQNYCVTVLPSYSFPNNMDGALKVFPNGYYSFGVDGKVLKGFPVVGALHGSFVRLYQDIFIAFDKELKSWVIFRVIVP